MRMITQTASSRDLCNRHVCLCISQTRHELLEEDVMKSRPHGGSLLDFLFGCRHSRTTFPLTLSHSAGSTTHVTCLDCGKEMPYNWTAMRLEGPAAEVCTRADALPGRLRLRAVLAKHLQDVFPKHQS